MNLGLGSWLLLMRKGMSWLDAKWHLREIYRKRDFLGDDILKWVIEERQRRP